MPRRKASEVENDEVLEPVAKKNETFVVRWFNDYAVDNKDDLKIVCDATLRSAEQQFSLYLKSKNSETYAAIFYGTFINILEFLKEKEKTYNEFTIEIGSSINIGFCNNTDENNEKAGNFMPILECTGTLNRNIAGPNPSDLTEQSSAISYISWKELNCKRNADAMKEIQEKTYQYLKKEFRINLRTSEAVIPLFCIFIDHLMNVLKYKYKELLDTNISEVSMKVLGLFEMFYSYNEETGQDIIDFVPSVFMKLSLKSDERAER